MKPERAITALTALADQATSWRVEGGDDLTPWKDKVRGVLVAALGDGDHLVHRLDQIGFSPMVFWEGMSDSVFTKAQAGGVREVCGVIDAALYQLQLRTEDNDEPTDARAFDPELWQHIRGLVEAEDWGKVASQTAIFVEDRLRSWAGDPKNGRGDSLVGKDLMGRVFSDDSDWRLGSRAAEREGWRALGTGFAAALSNVDRHRIQQRDDARRYAIGVLGLGSLLLTQMRHEHGDLIEDLQTGAES